MSAFAVLYDYSGSPLEPGLLERVMGRLSHRGPDGQDAFVSGPLAMGHWHFWTTPEEVGERQPLQVDDLPFRLVFDGRLDNREDLFAALSISVEEGRLLSDAALVLRAYAAWGERCVERFIGEFALVLFDERAHTLFCARDQLGDRTLFYTQHGSRMAIASEPWAVVGAQSAPVELDERAVAHYFALRATPDGQTLFKDVIELLPANVILINEHGLRLQRYWQPDFDRKIRYKTDEEYADHFRDLLEESVRCRMRSTTPVAVLMSGGLDSTSVASLAARMLAPQQLTTISYVFDKFPECDERPYIEAVKQKWNIRSLQVFVDNCWPYQDLRIDVNDVGGTPYQLHENLGYQQAKAIGVDVLITGGFGDHLYLAGRHWLADLLADKKNLEFLKELWLQINKKISNQMLRNIHIGNFARQFLHIFLCISSPNSKELNMPWLSDYLMGYLSKSEVPSSPSLERHSTLLGLMAANSQILAFFRASYFSVELRQPFRDRRLVEFVLALPAYQLYFLGYKKYILRSAMKGILPEIIRTREQVTSISSFYFYGVNHEQKNVDSGLQLVDMVWQRYLNKKWFAENLSQQDGYYAILIWRIISFSRWHQNYISG